ncbi:sulfurtransferase [Shewanella colwelliana]|uniref:Sulfurtransferase n=1 Tax=Shewanella colwelliana TaxID=23 RepID=A0ABQ4P186_SHECO|nr:sulfurtransferase [Shewanella colwelliana]GIU41279.1 sulfurtransferase [Shewanella colwelliana]
MEYPLVSTAWLEANLFEANLIVLDASMQSVVGKEPIVYDEFVAIPRAQQFDLEKVFCDLTSSQIHAMPTDVQFNQAIATFGIDSDSTVVIYDNQGIYSSPRAWWMFKAMGFERVFVLDGGLPQWLSEARMTVDSYHQPEQDRLGDFHGQYHSELVCDTAHLLARFDDEHVQVFDARGAQRFSGEMAEPRPNVRSGHIPGSVNLPFAQVLNGHRLKERTELVKLFDGLEGNDEQQRIFSCGSGITACILILASVAAGHHRAVLYDGSWAEWGSNHQLPISPAALKSDRSDSGNTVN